MPTTEGYNGAYTGQQIDEAIAKANAALPVPDGGTAGQILEKTESGTKWSDKPVMYVTVSENASDKSSDEIIQAVTNGYAVFARVPVLGLLYALPATYLNSSNSIVAFTLFIGDRIINCIINGTTATVSTTMLDAYRVKFEPGTTGLEAKNVQDAIEEVVSTYTTITLAADGWTGNSAPYSQQVACNIVKSDSAVVSVDAQTSGDPDANAEILNAWYLVSQKDPTQGAGTMTFYATEKPTVNIPVKVGVA